MTTAADETMRLLEVDLDLAIGGGALRIGGRDLPYTSVSLTSSVDSAPALTVETLALGGRVHGRAEVVYEVSYIDKADASAWPTAQGSTVPAALRALADAIEAEPIA